MLSSAHSLKVHGMTVEYFRAAFHVFEKFFSAVVFLREIISDNTVENVVRACEVVFVGGVFPDKVSGCLYIVRFSIQDWKPMNSP